MNTLATLTATSAAMAVLADSHPHMHALLLHREAEDDPERTSSIATDGTKIFIDGSFMSALKTEEAVSILASLARVWHA